VGGIETVVQDIAEGLNSRVDMKVLVCQPRGKAAAETINGVSVVRAKSYGIFLSMPLSLDFFRKFRRMSQQVDIIQFHEPFPLGDMALFLSGYKGKVVVWWHSDIVRQKVLGKILRPVTTWFLKRADSIIAATEGHIKSSPVLSQYTGKCKVVPYGLDTSKYSEPLEKDYLTKKLSVASHKKILFAGRIVYYKGIDILISAMEHADDAELFIAGGGPLENEMKTLVAKRKQQQQVHFLGILPRKDLLAAYYDCDMFVLPSNANSEAFGIVQLEAMSYGKPVINTDLPTGVPYVSLNEQTGLTVAAGDAAKLEDAITRLIKNDPLRQRYGEAAQNRVREHFALSSMLNNLYDIYQDLLAS
jgi:rhamnosyl/mannosyltransferase